MAAAVAALEVERALLLTRLSSFWAKRSRDLAAALGAVLGVRNVWCDTRTQDSAQARA